MVSSEHARNKTMRKKNEPKKSRDSKYWKPQKTEKKNAESK